MQQERCHVILITIIDNDIDKEVTKKRILGSGSIAALQSPEYRVKFFIVLCTASPSKEFFKLEEIAGLLHPLEFVPFCIVYCRSFVREYYCFIESALLCFVIYMYIFYIFLYIVFFRLLGYFSSK